MKVVLHEVDEWRAHKKAAESQFSHGLGDFISHLGRPTRYPCSVYSYPDRADNLDYHIRHVCVYPSELHPAPMRENWHPALVVIVTVLILGVLVAGGWYGSDLYMKYDPPPKSACFQECQEDFNDKCEDLLSHKRRRFLRVMAKESRGLYMTPPSNRNMREDMGISGQ